MSIIDVEETSMSHAAVLVVDDHPETCYVLVKLMKLRGVSAESVNSGEAALASIDADPPELVFLDWMMPGMTGLEVLRALRANHRFDQTSIVMYSAISDVECQHEALKSGAQDYIVKGGSAFTAIEQVLAKYVENKTGYNS